MTRQKLTHLDAHGAAHMVDVSDKPTTLRTARAQGCITMQRDTLDTILAGNAPKGDVFGTARLAGIMAAKETHKLIPLCHGLPVSQIDITITADDTMPGLRVETLAKVKANTGIEMEALTACSVACLTLYDMAKALDRSMVISDIKLLEKTGGHSGPYYANDPTS